MSQEELRPLCEFVMIRAKLKLRLRPLSCLSVCPGFCRYLLASIQTATFGRGRLLRPLYALQLRWGPQHQESPRRRNHGETSSLSALPLDSSMNDVVSAAFDNREDISLVLSSQERRAPHCRYALFYLEGGEKLDRPYPLPRKANMAKRIWHLHQFLTSL